MEYFKMEAVYSKKWQKNHNVTRGAANAKLAKFIPLIQKSYILFSCISTLSCTDHAEVIRNSEFGGDPWLSNPYYFCYHDFVARALFHAARLGIVGDQMDFVFDRNGVITDRANEMFQWIRNLPELSRDIASMMGDAVPGCDKKLPPLQAADILAYRVMEHCANPSNRKVHSRLLGISGTGDCNVTHHWRREGLQSFLDRLRRCGTNSIVSEPDPPR